MLCQTSTQPQYLKIICLYRGENDPMDLIFSIGLRFIFYPHQDEFMWNMSGVVCLRNIEKEQLDSWAPPQILKWICANHYGLPPLNLEYVHRPIFLTIYVQIFLKKAESVQKFNESIDGSMKSIFTRTQKEIHFQQNKHHKYSSKVCIWSGFH